VVGQSSYGYPAPWSLPHSDAPARPFPVKIAVVGCGAVGSYYGARLARAGHKVHFLLRSDYEAVRRNGVRIRSTEGDFEVRPQCARQPEEIGPADLVLIGLKTTANDQFPRLLPPLVGPGTAVLTLQNGLGNEEQLARLFPGDQILGGLCFVCLNRIAPGIIRHIGYGQVALGEFGRPPEPRTHDLAGRFNEADVPCSVTDNLARAHWEKLVWNIPFNGLGVAGAAGFDALERLGSGTWPEPGRRRNPPAHSEAGENSHRPTPATVVEAYNPAAGKPPRCLTADILLADARWARLVRELMLEVIAAARALGHDVPDAFAEEQIARTRTMGAYKASTLIDFERGQPLEWAGLFQEPLRQAATAGVATPRLAALCAVLRTL
jgi:2-dehydropantoate 2-reductase